MKRIFARVQAVFWPAVVVAACVHGWSQLDNAQVAVPFKVLFWIDVALLLASASRWLR